MRNAFVIVAVATLVTAALAAGPATLMPEAAATTPPAPTPTATASGMTAVPIPIAEPVESPSSGTQKDPATAMDGTGYAGQVAMAILLGTGVGIAFGLRARKKRLAAAAAAENPAKAD